MKNKTALLILVIAAIIGVIVIAIVIAITVKSNQNNNQPLVSDTVPSETEIEIITFEPADDDSGLQSEYTSEKESENETIEDIEIVDINSITDEIHEDKSETEPTVDTYIEIETEAKTTEKSKDETTTGGYVSPEDTGSHGFTGEEIVLPVIGLK